MASSRMSRLMIWANIVVLQVTNLLTGYVMSVMITYLNSVWKMSLTHAAAVVNVYGGTVAIMQWGMHFVVVAKMGNYWMISLSRCAFTTGFFLLTMSTPPVLYRATGTCSAYEAECIGTVQKILFYTALPLIALGVSGGFMVDAFKEEQLIKPLLEGTKTMKLFCWSVPKRMKLQSLQFLVSVLVLVTIAYLKPWLLRFGIAAICTSVATVILLISRRPNKPQGSLFTWQEIKSILWMSPICLFLILIAVVSALGNTYFTEQASKMNHKVGPLKVSILFLTMPRNMVRRWFSTSKWCAKNIAPRIGISVSMALAVLCCSISAIIEKRRLGVVESHGLLDKPDETIPMTMFWLLPQYLLLGGVCGLSKNSTVHFFTDMVLRWPKIEKDEGVKAKEESKPTEKDNEGSSVHIIKSPLDQANEEFKRTEKDGEVPNQAQDQSNSTENDSNKEKEESKRQYIHFFVDAVSGVGIIFSVLLVYMVGQIEPSWFQDTLNRSHLDYYYWTLATLNGANLLLFVLVIYLLGPEKQHVDDTIEGTDEEPVIDKDELLDLEANYMDTSEEFDEEEHMDWALKSHVARVRDETGSSLTRVNSNARKRNKSSLSVNMLGS